MAATAGPRDLAGATSEERHAIADDRRLGFLVGALSRSDSRRVEQYRIWYGDELYEQARGLWAGIQGRQVELRAKAMAVLAGQLDDENVLVRQKAATSVIAAVDAQNINRTKYDDLRDPDEFARAVDGVRYPTAPMVRVFREAWAQPCPAVLQIAAHVVGAAQAEPEMAQLLSALGWTRSG
jgi:hypothetical protein